MKNLTNIILEETITDSVEDIAKIMVFLEWLEGETQLLINYGDQTYNQTLEKYLSNIKASKEKGTNKITALSKEANVKLFERGGDIKTKIGIGLGSPAKDLIAKGETAKGKLADNRLDYLVELYTKYNGIHWIIWEYPKGNDRVEEMKELAHNSESLDIDWMYDVNRMGNTLYDYLDFLGR